MATLSAILSLALCCASLNALPRDGVLVSLATERVADVEKGTGGRSLAFRVALADGTRAYFKPEQSYAAYWFSEVASFHVDRLLALHRVSPVASRRLPWSVFAAEASDDPRRSEIRVAHDGSVRGAMIAWIDGELVPLALPDGWEAWLRFDALPKVSPFQSVSDWRRARVTPRPLVVPKPDKPDRAAELSDLVLFDHLIGNLDRWGGGFTNVRTLGRGGALIYLDNANGFEHNRVRSKLLRVRLEAVQRFRRRTIEAIRRFDINALEARLGNEQAPPILDRQQLAELEVRRRQLLEHVAKMQRRHGRAALPW
jgi:Golgi casein kinase Fam20